MTTLTDIERPVLKYTPDEFLVRESLFVPAREPGTDAGARFTYLEMRKSGLTTMEAVATVADHFGLADDRVHFAGHKDEDGITEQLIAVDRELASSCVARFNTTHQHRRHASVTLRLYGIGDEPIRTGVLTGNSFRIRIRNLSAEAVARLTATDRYEFYFLNYYDRQRFGLPNGPNSTHLIGQALLDCDYASALSLLRAARSPQSSRATDHAGTPEEFFDTVGNRVTSFYKSAHSSHLWNRRLRDLVADVCASDTYEDAEHGIAYLFSRRLAGVVAVLARQSAIEYRKHYVDESPAQEIGRRSTVVQTQVHCHGAGPDEAHTDRYRCDISFFLPAGAYATMCVRQLANAVDLVDPAACLSTIDKVAVR